MVGVPTVDYGSISGEGTATPAVSFAVTIPAGATCGAALPVDLKVNDATHARAHASGREACAQRHIRGHRSPEEHRDNFA